MIAKSNRTKLREIKKITYKIIRQTHDLERSGKKRNQILSKQINNLSPIVFMLDHMKNCLDTSFHNIKNEYLIGEITSYNNKFLYYSQMIKENSISKKALRKKIVSCMLTSHTRLFNLLLESELDEGSIVLPNPNNTSKLLQTAVMVWNNDFRK